MSKELLENIRHELVSINGLYVSDLDDFSGAWVLDYDDLIKELDKIL